MATSIADQVKAFFEKYPSRTFEKGEVLVQAEENPPGVFYLVEGRVNQYDISPAGSIIVVNVFQPPAFFPMSWAITKMPNSYFFEANTKVVVRRAPADEVVAFLKKNPDVAFDLLTRVYKGTEGLLRRMAHLMGGDAKSRLQFELLNAAYRFGQTRPDGKLFVPLKESDIASQSGLARETINRNVQSLKANGLVEVTHQGFILPDIRKLEKELGRDL